MSPICVLLTTQCPLCGSPVVWVKDEGSTERLICPVCWAMGERGEGGISMQRGLPIPASLKYLVDKARFPRSAAPPDERPESSKDPGCLRDN